MRKIVFTILFSAIIMAMFGLAGCNNEDNVDTSQQDIDSYIDVSKISNIKDWHFVGNDPLGNESLEIPDWVRYVAADCIILPDISMNIAYCKWNVSAPKYYGENGDWMGIDAYLLEKDIETTDWHYLTPLDIEIETKPFDVTSMFGKQINHPMIGIWKHEAESSNTFEYIEFRSNGSGRQWKESGGMVTKEKRFLFTIVDGPSDGVSANWTVVKKATEDDNYTRYEIYVVDGNTLNYATNISPYLTPSEDPTSASSSSFKRQ